MRIAVASGKGGTGKTTVALALAECAGPETLLVDCDVEEPDDRLFTKAPVESSVPVEVPVPMFSPTACTGCGACVKACRFRALAQLEKRILVFPGLCHSCGGCTAACTTGSLLEVPYRIGVIESRRDPRFRMLGGVMTVGHVSSPPLIRRLLATAIAETVILDAPPGTACPMVATVRGCDYVILVTEPTPFGLHDLKLAADTLTQLGVKHGVILNRATDEDTLINPFCLRRGIPLLLQIPFSRAIAEHYARGESPLATLPGLYKNFHRLLAEIRART